MLLIYYLSKKRDLLYCEPQRILTAYLKGVIDMIKTIELTWEEANRIYSNKEGSAEWNTMSRDEKNAAQKMIDKNSGDRVDTFHDISGNAYVMLHGGHTTVDDREVGILWFNRQFMIPDLVYSELVESGFIEDGEILNVICCHGGYQQSKCHPMNFINSTKKCIATRTIVNNNDNVTLVMYTHDTVLEKVAAELKCRAIIKK